MKFLNARKIIVGLVLILIFILTVYFFDKGLSMGFGLVFILSGVTFFVLNKLGFKDKKIYLLFSIVLVIHLGATLFMHYANFQPFSGGTGDYVMYQKQAVNIAEGFRQGDFSIQSISSKHPNDLAIGHFYPVILGAIYAITMPEEIIGLMFNVWLVALSIIFVYLIVLEIGGSEKNAFIIGLITNLYPSYVFVTGLLLKETIEMCFVALGSLFLVKIIKRFTWYNFLILYLTLIATTHFRFYVGYALLGSFVFSWFLCANMNFKKRVIYGVVFIIILGTVPYFAVGQGYYGINSFEKYLNFKTVNYYRQVAYMPVPATTPAPTETPPAPTPTTPAPTETPPAPTPTSMDSSFVAESTPLGYVKSFVYVLLGPFPWQIKNLRQLLALTETLPWYFLLFFIVDGIIVIFRKRIREAAPLLIFSIAVMVVMTIFNSNFGIIVRIRIPAFISLLCIATYGFTNQNIIYNYINKIYGKMLSYGRGRFYSQPLSR